MQNLTGPRFVWCPTGHCPVLGPLLFSLYITDISIDIDSEIKLFADDYVCHREIKDTGTHTKTSERYRSIGILGKEMGYEISSCQMQYDPSNKTIHVSYTHIRPRKRRKYQSKKISNDQDLIQSDPISCPQNQKGNN